MSDRNFNSKAERLAHRWFEIFNNHKMLLLFLSMLMLTGSSIYFNMRLGRLSASPADLTWWVLPAAYSFLDIALLCIGLALFAGVIRGLLWVVSWVWFVFLLMLSLWACLSCIIALDAEKASSGDSFKRQQLERALADANDSVSTWKRNTALTIKHKTRFNDTLNDEIKKRDRIVKEISKLDATTPPNLIIFEKAEVFLPVWLDSESFQTLARLVFGFALVITPLVVGAVLSQVLSVYSTRPTPPNGGRRNAVSPGESDSFGQNKWQNFNTQPEPAPIRAEKAESAHGEGRVAQAAALNREALGKVREWLRSEEGRVTRQQIKYRSGNLNYENVTLIIGALLSEGWLHRMSNNQLKAGKPKLKAVI